MHQGTSTTYKLAVHLSCTKVLHTYQSTLKSLCTKVLNSLSTKVSPTIWISVLCIPGHYLSNDFAFAAYQGTRITYLLTVHSLCTMLSPINGLSSLCVTGYRLSIDSHLIRFATDIPRRRSLHKLDYTSQRGQRRLHSVPTWLASAFPGPCM